MRLFVAAYPTADALDDLERVVGALRVAQAAADGINARVSARPLWHVTLAFLGEVDDAKVAQASRAVDRAAEHAHPCSLRIAGGGHFGRKQFTLLWAGIAGDLDVLRRTAATVRREMRASRFSVDEKRFQPHITVARPGDRLAPEAIEHDIAALNDYQGPLWVNTEIMLMASNLGPHPTHELIHSASLH